MKSSFLIPVACLLVLAACQSPLPEQSNWEGEVQISEGRIVQLRMHLDLRTDQLTGYFLVGDEQTQIPEIHRHGDSLFFVISEYGAEMRALWKSGKLVGRYYRFRADTTFLEFSARPEKKTAPYGTAVPPETTPPVRLVGKFQAYFKQGDKIDSTKGATFWIKNDSIYGTILDPSGDHGLFVGLQKGNRVELHRFTGWQINLIELQYSDGAWHGKYFSRNLPPESFRLVPRVDLTTKTLPTRVTKMRNPKAPFVFEGVTTEGDTLKNTADRFKGKASIIDIMGTWCHNCLDAAPLLQQLYSEFKGDGLEVVGLSFELKDDLALAQKNLRIYSKRHGINFPLLFCGTIERKNVDARLRSQLEDFFSYPTTIFVDRKGIVRKIHTGFSGPGTGEEYQREIETFYATVRELLKK